MQDKLPTNQGEKTIPEIFSTLMYGSYAANRDEGMTHEQLINLGIGNDYMKIKYESE
jgi:hypothetical protein